MTSHAPTWTVVTGRFLADYRRNPVNLVFLLLVPVVFVIVAAPALSDAAALLGGAGNGAGVEVATAGWAAGFLAGIAMYFQVSSARNTDRRLVLAGLPRRHLVTARLATGGVLAVIASLAALSALAAGTGVDDPGRAVAGTLMFAVIYLAIGAVVGARVPAAVNGTIVVLFVWILDVFFGPTLSASTAVVTRLLPTHFVTLWTAGVPSRHGGPAELSWALAWVAVSLLVAFTVVSRAARVATPRRHANPGSVPAQLGIGLRMAGRAWRRTPVFAVLLAVVPAVFIWLADAITPPGHTAVTLVEHGREYVAMLDPAEMHAGTMAPIAVGSLAALAGVLIALDAPRTDARLVQAGQRRSVVVGTRLASVAGAALLATVVSVAVTATVFDAHQWGVYLAANLLVALTYGLLGVLVGRTVGLVSGVFLAFLIPFLDLGIAQSPMLQGAPRPWADWLPGYGSVRVLLDGALTGSFDTAGPLLQALGWLLLLLALTCVVLTRTSPRPAAARPLPVPRSPVTGGSAEHGALSAG